MRACWLLIAATVALATFLQPDAAFAEKRMALVIGNGSYESFAPIKTAEKDAADISAALSLAEFEVMTATNLDAAAMKKAIAEFGEHAKDAHVVVFYFAGQGVQTDGRNYLIPVDTKASRAEVFSSGIELDQILKHAPSKAAMLMFLDAGRRDPFPGKKGGVTSPSSGGSQPQLQFILFSTAPGAEPIPISGLNGAFATALLKHIKGPSLSLAQLGKAVRAETVNLTNGRQIPWSHLQGNADAILFSTRR